MVNSLLDKLDSDQVKEILDRLNVQYRRNLDRRAANLRSHFKSKEANDEQTRIKQHNILFLMMETVKAKSRSNVFEFPSAATSSDNSAFPSSTAIPGILEIAGTG